MPKYRAVARILFQPRQRGEPGVWGLSPQRGPGAEPLVRGIGVGAGGIGGSIPPVINPGG